MENNKSVIKTEVILCLTYTLFCVYRTYSMIPFDCLMYEDQRTIFYFTYWKLFGLWHVCLAHNLCIIRLKIGANFWSIQIRFYINDLYLILNFQVTGNTPLMLAVKENKTPLIDRFIELGSDVCARNNVSRKVFYDDIYYTFFFYDVVKLNYNHSLRNIKLQSH